MSRETVAMAKGIHLHNGSGPGVSVDDAIVMAGNVAMLQAQVEAMTRNVTECRRLLDAANERNRALAADLSRLAQINAGQASIIWTQAHELDAWRRRRHVVTLTDRGDAVDGYEVML